MINKTWELPELLSFLEDENNKNTRETQAKKLPQKKANFSYLPSDPEVIEQSMGKLISGLKTQPRGLMFDEVAQRSNRRDNNLRDAINWKAENGRVPSKAPEVDANGSLVRKVPLTVGAMDVDGSVREAAIQSWRQLNDTDPPEDSLILSDGFVSTFSGNNVRKVTDLSEEERKNILIDLDARMDQDLGGIEANQTAKITLAAEDHHQNNRHIAEQWSLLEKELGDSRISDYTLDDRQRVLRLVVSQAMSQGGLDYLPSDLNDEVRVLASVLTDNDSKFKQMSMDETVTRLSEALDGMDGDISFVAALKYAAKSTRNQKTDSGFGDINFPWETTSSILGGLLGAGHALASTALAYAEDEKYATMVKSRWETHQQTNITPLIKSITDWYGLNKWKYGSSGDGSIKMPPPAAIKNLSMIMLQDIDPAMGRQNTAQAYGLRVAMIRSYHTQLHNEDEDKDARASVAMGLIEAVREFGELPKGIDFTNLPTDADGLIKLGQRITTALSKKLPAIEAAVRSWTHPNYRYRSNMLKLFKQTFPDAKTPDGKSIDTYEDYRKLMHDVAWNSGKYSKQDGLTMMKLFNASHKAFVGLIPKAGQVNEHTKREFRMDRGIADVKNNTKIDLPVADNPFNLVLGGSPTSVLNGMYDGHYQKQYEQAYRNINDAYLGNVWKLGAGTDLLKNRDGTDMTEAELKASASVRHTGFIREGGGINFEAFEAGDRVTKAAFIMTVLGLQEQTGKIPAQALLVESLKNSIILPDSDILSRGGDIEGLHQFMQTLGLYDILLNKQAQAGDVTPLTQEYFLMEELGLQKPDIAFMKIMLGHIKDNEQLAGLMSEDFDPSNANAEVIGQALQHMTKTIIEQLQDTMRNTDNIIFGEGLTSDSWATAMTNNEEIFSGSYGTDRRAHNDTESTHDKTYTNGQVTANNLRKYGIHIPYDKPEDMEAIITQLNVNNILPKNIDYDEVGALNTILGGLAKLDSTRRNYLVAAGRLNDNREGKKIDLLEILQMSAFALDDADSYIISDTGEIVPATGDFSNSPKPDSPEFGDDLIDATGLTSNPWAITAQGPGRRNIQAFPGGMSDIAKFGMGRGMPLSPTVQYIDPEEQEAFDQFTRDALIDDLNGMVQTGDEPPRIGNHTVNQDLWDKALNTAIDSSNNPETGWVEGVYHIHDEPALWDTAWNFGMFSITHNLNLDISKFYSDKLLGLDQPEYKLTINRSDVLMTAVYHYWKAYNTSPEAKENPLPFIGTMSLSTLAANIESHNGMFYGRDILTKDTEGDQGRVRLKYITPTGVSTGFDIGPPKFLTTPTGPNTAKVFRKQQEELRIEEERKKKKEERRQKKKERKQARNLRGSMLHGETILPEAATPNDK